MGNGKAYGLIHDECRRKGRKLTMAEFQEGEQHISNWVITLVVDQQHTFVGTARTRKLAIKEAALKVAAAWGMQLDVDSD